MAWGLQQPFLLSHLLPLPVRWVQMSNMMILQNLVCLLVCQKKYCRGEIAQSLWQGFWSFVWQVCCLSSSACLHHIPLSHSLEWQLYYHYWGCSFQGFVYCTFQAGLWHSAHACVWGVRAQMEHCLKLVEMGNSVLVMHVGRVSHQKLAAASVLKIIFLCFENRLSMVDH